jgi:hypothetical protein
VGYVPGDFWRIDDRTGFKVRSSQTREEWTGAIVDKGSWEARHPQDFVRGKKDDQRVPDARPRPTDVFTGGAVTTLASNAAAQSYLIVLTSTTGLNAGDYIRVMLDSGDTFLTRIFAFLGTTVTLYEPLPGTASAGNAVTHVMDDDTWVNLDFTDHFNSHWA